MNTGYPTPEENPKCHCWPNLMAAMFCPEGHMTECHAGMTCDEAECSHWQAENEDDDLYDEPYDDYGADEQYEDEQEDV